ncbi:SDR family NAD(P)-dependent oxidoreductase [Micromonospora olivasterospora]|uniref:Enediyne polyketide synthase n=1 Tax=Micromonospora olivasterospora TaxID=1880 RepID=A0A562I3A7_MICOL|nr:enediyne polyketide synthase [Micromonospora olivasterospora]
MDRIAIVGMACRYPDADSPGQLWENVLAGRRAFRRIPDERTRLEDYWSPDPAAPDRFYARHAALLRDYQFDRLAHRVAGSTYRSTDLTHWLALDVAGRALADAGFPDGAGLPRDRTAVIVGNTLTGEFSRANVMRLRWPYVRRTVAAALAAEGWPDARTSGFLAELEQRYKAPFPAVDEDTLAGGLSNTIAGRICNHFDLNGGGYSVDGACSSSLLSVVTACRSLAEGDVAVALAGGVDLSIDPFEMVGFAKAGALARDEMRVYDRFSQGFWPGEGCGLVVLMRERDALAGGHRIYTTIAGWGVSSDGRGGITRPEADGHRLALDRAYRRAGYPVSSVPLFEGHGTGTAVGDATELRALSEARRAADPGASPAAIGSVKAMIGHTKAAAGVAGLIKAALALHHEVVPATTGCVEPHEELSGAAPALRVPRRAEPWPGDAPVRAGVTALGFGGINTHLALDSGPAPRRAALPARSAALARTTQDTELLLLDADGPDALRTAATRLADRVGALSYAELADLAAALQRRLRDRPWRAAVVAASPEAADRGLRRVAGALDQGRDALVEPAAGVFLGHAARPARLGFLFPGQGSGRRTDGGALRRRFAVADEVYRNAAPPPATGDPTGTAEAQPRIVTASVAALRVLAFLGLDADLAVGHSLGELTALHWAGAFDADDLRETATARGAIMADSPDGAMAGLAAAPARVRRIIGAEPVVVAGYNGPEQTVVAGPPDAVARCRAAATAAGVGNAAVAVSRAFHSPLMREAADRFGSWLSHRPFRPLRRRVLSTVTGAALPADVDLADLLVAQVVRPVLFAQAVTEAAADVDLFVEVGPGRVLTRLVAPLTPVPAVSVDTDDDTLAGVFAVFGAAYALGAPVAHAALFEGRPNRPLDPEATPRFLASPCESAPQVTGGPPPVTRETPAEAPAEASGDDELEVLRRLVAERAELPAHTIGDDVRLLDELHLSSITIGQLVNQAARRLGLAPLHAPTNVATARLRDLAEALRDLSDREAAPPPVVAGVAPWVRPFAVEWTAEPAAGAPGPGGPAGRWQAHPSGPSPGATALAAALERAGLGDGVLLVLAGRDADEPPGEDELAVALTAVQAALDQPPGGRLVVVQRGRGVAALARTAHLEAADLTTTVVDVDLAEPGAVGRVVADVAATAGFAESRHDRDGVRRVPVLRALPEAAGDDAPPLGPGDVLLATGGGKGITAECALALARDTGARLVLLGRSDPVTDAELAASLDRMRAFVPTLRYERVDVTDAAAVRATVADVAATWGHVTAVLHGAGHNEPTPLAKLDVGQLADTLAPKLTGLRTVLDAVDPDRLRLLVTFGSIIGRAGLHGEAHYALANDWLAGLTERFAAGHPACRALCLEWSVWAGIGMGERLSVVEGLRQAGIQPVHTDQGVAVLRRLVADPATPASLVVAGRVGGLDTVRFARPELPLLRFVERPLVHYPGVELVTEATLGVDSDPYLDDHRLDDNLLFPAVLGLEAMAQVATALRGGRVVAVENAGFPRPIVVAPGGRTTVRIAALAAGPDAVRVVIRSDETAFAVDHFTATVLFTTGTDRAPGPRPVAGHLAPVELTPQELYEGVLFQGGRFRRLARYRRVTARDVEFDATVADDARWFSPFLPDRLLLGDPGARDALMHGIQVCVPDATLLPAAIGRIELAGPPPAAPATVSCVATERRHDGDTYVYDLAVHGPDGALLERWTGLRLTGVGRRDAGGPWPAALLGPLLERRLAATSGAPVGLAAEPAPAGTARRAATALALTRLLGREPALRHRADGRPELAVGPAVSASHGAGLTLVAAGDPVVACDAEPVAARSAADRAGLLGPHAALAELLARQCGEPPDVAATRVWCAVECLQKAGRPTDTPLTAGPDGAGAWQELTSPGLRILTLATRLGPTGAAAVLAVLTTREG